MNKVARKSLIRELAIARGMACAFVGLMSVSRAEVREETQNVTRGQVTDSITDEELNGVESTLPFDTVKETKGKDGETLLTAKERAQLAKDVADAQLAKRLRFALVVIQRPNDEAELNEFNQLASVAHS